MCIIEKCPFFTKLAEQYGYINVKILISDDNNNYFVIYVYCTLFLQWVTGVYFFLAFFTDIMPLSLAKSWFRQFSDWFFTTLTWPLALVSFSLFLLFVPLSSPVFSPPLFPSSAPSLSLFLSVCLSSHLSHSFFHYLLLDGLRLFLGFIFN